MIPEGLDKKYCETKMLVGIEYANMKCDNLIWLEGKGKYYCREYYVTIKVELNNRKCLRCNKCLKGGM